MIKAVIMDGDGSTITSENKVPNNLMQLIQKNQTTKWIMASGRSLELLKLTPIIDFLSTDVPHILDGGSCLMTLSGQCNMRYCLTAIEVELLFQKIVPDLLNFIYYSYDGVTGYTYSRDKDIHKKFKFRACNPKYTNQLSEFYSWVTRYPAGKILLNSNASPDLAGLYYQSNEDNYDITSSGIDKGSACIRLLKELNLKAEEVAFVFNDKNDLPLVNNLLLKNIVKIKVGADLPGVISDFLVANPYQVADVLQKIL